MDGRSRRLSAPATRWSDFDPNGLPGGHRGVSHTHRKLPHLHGGSFASLGRGTPLGARRPGFFGPTPQPAVWSKPWPGGVVGGRRGTPSRAPCLRFRPEPMNSFISHIYIYSTYSQSVALATERLKGSIKRDFIQNFLRPTLIFLRRIINYCHLFNI